MQKNKIKQNKIKIITGILILFFVISGNVKAISLSDVEFLISIGVIPADQADFARQAAGAVNQQNVGGSLKTDPSSELECLVFNQNLVKGQSGTVVSAMQKFLQRLGHFPKDQQVTGFYGDTTVYAVADFQLAYGLIKSRSQIGAGAVGPITRAKIQEVSCKQVSDASLPTAPAQTTPSVTPTISATTPVISNTFVKPVTSYIKPELTLKSFTTYDDIEKGVYHFRYDINVSPRKEVAYFKVKLVCIEGTLSTNRSDIFCGKSLILKPSTKGTKSFKIGFTNLTKAFQTIGIGVEAFNENDKSLDFAEIINEIPAAKPVTYINQTLADGSKTQYGIPEARNCDPNEQLEFLKYTMTVTQDSRNPIVPPTCWPGDIRCDFNLNYPPTYCQIPNGPTSNDLCPSNQRFYNGKCINRSA